MNINMRKLSLVTALSLAGLVTACGGGGSDSTSTAGSSNGMLGVAMTDAPACGFDDVSVTVSKVRVHQSSSAGENDAGWTDITLSPARTINLLNLTNGVLENLGETPLAAGKYTQLRLVLAANTPTQVANSVILSGTTARIALDTPSAAQSGLKLVNEFTVAAGQRTDLVLDFDACKSVIAKGGSGNYALRPVIKVIPTVLNGIDGVIDPTVLAGGNVMITAQQNGTVISGTVPNAVTGAFSLSRLVPGNYDVVVTADNRATKVVGAVPVATATSRVSLSTTVAPLTLLLASTPGRSVAGAVTLTPASSTEVSYVAAKQTLGTGPTVTVKYQGVDVTTGNYALTQVPSVSPEYAVYATTLPLVFSSSYGAVGAVNPVAGKYAVTASATGYTSKSTAVDVTLLNQTGLNFSLAP